MDVSKVPVYDKPASMTAEIVDLLKKSFLTKNLNQNELKMIAGAMKP